MRLVWSINRAFALVNKRTILPKRCTSSYFCISEKKLQTNTNLLNKLQIQTNIDVKNPKFYCTSQELVDALKFEEVCEETLESLCEYFDTLIENNPDLKGSDVVYGDGVLTVSFGSHFGTYVINRQTPNRQIWLSSPTSGPKRYDFVMKGDGYWVYKHDGVSLHQLLQSEINKIVKNTADFSKCSHSLV